jgi:hypothetical protein
MSFMNELVVKTGPSHPRRAARVSVQGLKASYWTGLQQRWVPIKNISPTGIYLHTDDRWLPGKPVLLTLQSEHPLQPDSAIQVKLWARAVRLCEDGVALAFVHNHVSTSDWLNLMLKAASLTSENDAVRVFGMANALAFLLRISPSDEDQILQFISEQIKHENAQTALDTVLLAEELLESQNRAPRGGVSVKLPLRILEYASTAKDEQMRQCWAGLMAACSLSELTESDILKLAEILAHLDLAGIRILTAVCTRAMQIGWQPGLGVSHALHTTRDELGKITGTTELSEISRTLHCLSNLGLLELSGEPFEFETTGHAGVTPTGLGLEFCAKCNGQMEPIEFFDCSGLQIAS